MILCSLFLSSGRSSSCCSCRAPEMGWVRCQVPCLAEDEDLLGGRTVRARKRIGETMGMAMAIATWMTMTMTMMMKTLMT